MVNLARWLPSALPSIFAVPECGKIDAVMPRAVCGSRGVVTTWVRGADMVTVPPAGRTCNVCGEWKPADCFSFYDGRLRSRCKPCQAAKNNARYHADPARVLAQQAAYSLTHREQKAAYDREYNARTRERRSEQKNGLYYARKAAGIKREIGAKEREENRLKARARYVATPDVLKARIKAYQSKNREKVRAWQEDYRARRRDGDGVSSREWEAILDQAGYRCLACGATEPLTMDHVRPLSRGGRHTPSNVQVLCKPCNSKKHTATVDYRASLRVKDDG